MRVFLAMLALLVSADAHATSREVMKFCEPMKTARETLKKRFQMAPVGVGETNQGRAIELFVAKSGDWMLLVHYPNSESCVIDRGHAWIPQKWQDPAGRTH